MEYFVYSLYILFMCCVTLHKALTEIVDGWSCAKLSIVGHLTRHEHKISMDKDILHNFDTRIIFANCVKTCQPSLQLFTLQVVFGGQRRI